MIGSWKLRGVSVRAKSLIAALLVAACCQVNPDVRVMPSEVELAVGGTVEFTVLAVGLDPPSVTWAATCGTIAGTGNTVNYTAPAVAGSCSVTATSVIRSDLSATALVTVVDPDDGSPEVPVGATGTVTGTVYMPDGVTPVSAAFVGVPRQAAGTGSATRQTPHGASDADWVTSTFSGADGSFSLSGVPAGLTTLRITKGRWSLTLQANVTEDGTTVLAPGDTTLPSSPDAGAPSIAVIAGAYDRMEDVLAKIGLGEVDEDGHLIPGTEQFDIYAGGAEEIRNLLTDAALLNSYDIVFINCGASIAPYWPPVQQGLQDFVAQGGVLYLTDLTYNIVESSFPGRVEFRGPEGKHGITTDAEVLTEDSVGQSFSNWLANENVLNPDGTVHIEGFSIGWAVIESIDDSVRVWVRGEVTYGFTLGSLDGPELGPTQAAVGRCCQQAEISPSQGGYQTSVRPLTVSFSHGAGRVLYTSYHTVHKTPRPELYPQEVVLAGLVFEQ